MMAAKSEPEIVGWQRPSGTAYCVGHKPAAHEGDLVPVYASEVDEERCAVCGDDLVAEAFRRGWLG